MNKRLYNKIAFLDRDGFLNTDNGYTHKIEDLCLIDGSIDFCKKLVDHGYTLHIVTNQAGIARRIFSEGDSILFTTALMNELSRFDIEIAGFEFCPHHPEYQYKNIQYCNCRKPNPGMINTVLQKFQVHPNKCIIAGDKLTDILAGYRAGIKLGYLLTETPDVRNKRFSLQIDKTFKLYSGNFPKLKKNIR